jgi:hypothetical protein
MGNSGQNPLSQQPVTAPMSEEAFDLMVRAAERAHDGEKEFGRKRMKRQ